MDTIKQLSENEKAAHGKGDGESAPETDVADAEHTEMNATGGEGILLMAVTNFKLSSPQSPGRVLRRFVTPGERRAVAPKASLTGSHKCQIELLLQSWEGFAELCDWR